MKRIFTLLIGIIFSIVFVKAQEEDAPPYKFSYKATITKSNGAIIANKTIGLLIKISPDGYEETFTPTTNEFGQIDIIIGSDENKDLSDIKWSVGTHFLEVWIDVKGGENYILMSSTQLLSVPYALYAGSARDIIDPETTTFSHDLIVNELTIGKGSGSPVVNYNTALGKGTLFSNSTGNWNTATGDGALYSNINGYRNTANGYVALFNNQSGVDNTAVGYYGLYNNINGHNNTAIGSRVLYMNTSGENNTGTGYGALESNTTADNNTAIGYMTLHTNTEGYENTASGVYALYNNTTGHGNTAVGFYGLLQNTIGEGNTAIGYQALEANYDGIQNTASGGLALWKNTSGIHNTATGFQALQLNTEGHDNTADGFAALVQNSEGHCNTAVGYVALQTNKSGGFNTAIGYAADVTQDNLTNATAIGNSARVDASNKIVLGNSSVATIGGYGEWTTYSDRRLKENIIYKSDLGLDFILKLRPVTFNYKNDVNKRICDGFIAQDVEQVLKELGLEFSGLIIDDNPEKTMNLSYPKFIVPLVKAVQEQQKQIEELKSIINQLLNQTK